MSAPPACSHDGMGLPGCSVCDPDVDELERRANDPYTCDGFRRRDVQKLTARIRELEARLLASVTAMEIWGSWEDGIPEGGPGEYGVVGNAYDAAVVALCLSGKSDERVKLALRNVTSVRDAAYAKGRADERAALAVWLVEHGYDREYAEPYEGPNVNLLADAIKAGEHVAKRVTP